MEIHVQVDDEFAIDLQIKLRTKRSKDIARVALTILNWSVDEMSKGRMIFSGNRDGKHLHRLAMPILDAIKVSEH
jgi:hypothetical protein